MNKKFKTKRLKERLVSNERLKKEYGHLAKPIGHLMDVIKGMNRRELYSLPGFHELKEQAKGVFAVTIKHPHHLIFSAMPSMYSSWTLWTIMARTELLIILI